MGKVKNKHGRVGVKRYVPRRPLDIQQRMDAEQRGYAAGVKMGFNEARQMCLDLALNGRKLKEVRKEISRIPVK
jgi:hypothetical protein